MTYKDSYIHLKDLRFYAYHGVLSQERKVGAQFLVNLRVQVDFQQAAETDELQHTVNYADLYKVVQEEMQQPSQLLEHVAGRISRRLYRDFPAIQSINITVEKESAPIGTGAQGLAGVELFTTRD